MSQYNMLQQHSRVLVFLFFFLPLAFFCFHHTHTAAVGSFIFLLYFHLPGRFMLESFAQPWQLKDAPQKMFPGVASVLYLP